MRMVGLLVALAIVGMMVYKQLGRSTTATASAPAITAISTPEESNAPPRIPTHPGGLSEFDAAMDSYMETQATSRMPDYESRAAQAAEQMQEQR